MKRIIPILLAVMLCAVLFVACTEPEAPTVNMTEYYAAGRTAYKLVTGIELPELGGLGMDPEDPSYATTLEYLRSVTAESNEICFDIYTNGDGPIDFQSYTTFENFLKEKLGDCDPGYPTGNEASGRECQWTVDGRWYEASWYVTVEYVAIFLNSTLAP